MNLRNETDVRRSNLGEYAKEQILNAIKEKAYNRNTSSVANRKPGAKMAKKYALEIHENKKFSSPVRIHFCSFRRKAADLDNIQGKAVLDAIVDCGILQDDGQKFIPERPSHSIKVSKEEKTVIEIEEI